MAETRKKVYRNRLVIMARQPAAGRVKTRLASQIGTSAALHAYRGMLNALLREAGRDRRWETWLAVTPATSVSSPAWPSSFARMAQSRGDLGRRMQHVLDTAPPGPVVITGCDIPGIRRSHIAAAFAALGGHDAVVGPAPDGGYWLIGARRLPRTPRPFEGVRWSSPHALADTLANMGGLKVAMLAQLEDVDDEAAYRRWRADPLCGR